MVLVILACNQEFDESEWRVAGGPIVARDRMMTGLRYAISSKSLVCWPINK